LRLEPGTEVEVFDGQGLVARGRLTDSDDIEILEAPHASAERTLVDVAVPILKGDRQDWLVEKLCELGVGTLIPLVTERSVINELSDSKRARFERLMEAACKQSGRNRAMVIRPPCVLAELNIAYACVLDPSASLSLHTVIVPNMTLVIGPEGGFCDAEIRWLDTQNATRARLSDHVLRAETAAIAAVSVAVTALTANGLG